MILMIFSEISACLAMRAFNAGGHVHDEVAGQSWR